MILIPMSVYISILVLFLLLLVISAIVAWKLIHPSRLPLHHSPRDYELNYQSISFQSREDKVILKGWFLPAQTEQAKMTIIFSHGYRSNRLESKLPALKLAKDLVTNGFHVLMYDFRNCGESPGSMTSVGMLEKRDLLGAVDWVKANLIGPIGLIGFSMGASTSLIAAAETPEVMCVVSDSSFTRLSEYMNENLHVWSKFPHFPFTPIILMMFRWMAKMNADDVYPLHAANLIYPRPILFIHGDQDRAIPKKSSIQMFQQHPDVFSIWIVPGAGHVEAYATAPEEYTTRVINFFDSL